MHRLISLARNPEFSDCSNVQLLGVPPHRLYLSNQAYIRPWNQESGVQKPEQQARVKVQTGVRNYHVGDSVLRHSPHLLHLPGNFLPPGLEAARK